MPSYSSNSCQIHLLLTVLTFESHWVGKLSVSLLVRILSMNDQAQAEGKHQNLERSRHQSMGSATTWWL